MKKAFLVSSRTLYRAGPRFVLTSWGKNLKIGSFLFTQTGQKSPRKCSNMLSLMLPVLSILSNFSYHHDISSDVSLRLLMCNRNVYFLTRPEHFIPLTDKSWDINAKWFYFVAN